MAVRQARDLDATRRALTWWLGRRLDAAGLSVEAVRAPATTGFSGENLVVDATWIGPDGQTARRFVVRVAPTTFQLFPRPRFWQQYHVQRLLAERSDVPVAPVFGFEHDPQVLGAPFYVLGHVAGSVPADLPSYHTAGWLFEASGGIQARAWNHGVEVLARIHRFDPAPLAGHLGPAGAAAQLDELAGDAGFFGCAEHPTVHRGLEWLRGNLPADDRPPVLRWGDARLGNLVFAGGAVRAALDWELVGLGAPERDLAWYLHLDRHLSEGIGAPRLPGLPDAARTVAAYERATGRPVRALDCYRVLAAVQFAMLTARLAVLATGHALLPTDFPLHRNASRLLANILEEVGG
ncbi:phosphotransferase family protein [Dactylosporangium sp. NPDC048998]|uniref:phosphotransferase family protein n=1 Tax=Dactylosporangium sp. NPDC048998 TaxID=3363976 RepID=UPI003716A0C8